MVCALFIHVVSGPYLDEFGGEFPFRQNCSFQLHLDEEASNSAEAGTQQQAIFLPFLVHKPCATHCHL